MFQKDIVGGAAGNGATGGLRVAGGSSGGGRAGSGGQLAGGGAAEPEAGAGGESAAGGSAAGGAAAFGGSSAAGGLAGSGAAGEAGAEAGGAAGASGGATLGGTNGAGGSPACGGGATLVSCGSKCVNIANDAENCRACGHSCGTGATCVAGVCQPVVLYTSANAISYFDVDDERVYFGPSGISACPNTGCVLSPAPVTPSQPGSAEFAANGYVNVALPEPNPPYIGQIYTLCPGTGCGSNQVQLAAANRQLQVSGMNCSAHNCYYSDSNPGGRFLRSCIAPAAGACTAQGTLIDTAAESIFGTDTTVYFTASIAGADPAVYSCPAEVSGCVPTPMNLPPVVAHRFAYVDDLYIVVPGPNPATVISKCPRSGCPTSPAAFISIPEKIDDFALDAGGVYWINGDAIRMCPASGCGNGPVTIANAERPEQMKLSQGFVYWVNGADNTIRRVALPAVTP